MKTQNCSSSENNDMKIGDDKRAAFEERLSERKDIYVRTRDIESRKTFIESIESQYGMVCDIDTTKQEVIDSSFPIKIICKEDHAVYTSNGWNTTTAACAVQSGVVFSEDDFYAYYKN